MKVGREAQEGSEATPMGQVSGTQSSRLLLALCFLLSRLFGVTIAQRAWVTEAKG